VPSIVSISSWLLSEVAARRGHTRPIFEQLWHDPVGNGRHCSSSWTSCSAIPSALSDRRCLIVIEREWLGYSRSSTKTFKAVQLAAFDTRLIVERSEPSDTYKVMPRHVHILET
jgi:hypothetical protein